MILENGYYWVKNAEYHTPSFYRSHSAMKPFVVELIGDIVWECGLDVPQEPDDYVFLAKIPVMQV